MGNCVLALPELHTRKNVFESVLRYRPFLLNILIPLWIDVVPYAKKKWEAVRAELIRLRDGPLASAPEGAAATTRSDGDDGDAEPTNCASAPAASRQDDEDNRVIDAMTTFHGIIADSYFPFDQTAPGAGDAHIDDDNEPMAGGALLGVNVCADALRAMVLRAVDVPDPDAEDNVVDLTEASGDDAAPQTFATKKALRNARMSTERLKAELEKRGVATNATTKADLIDALWKAIKPKANASLTGNENTVSTSLHRGKQFFYHLLLIWCGCEFDWPAGRSTTCRQPRSLGIGRELLQSTQRNACNEELAARRRRSPALSR